MPVRKTLNGPVPVKIWTDKVESQALDQLKRVASLPFVFHHVAAMPDVHLGMGAAVGSVVATKGAVMPAAVGVDIGCGMCAMKLKGITESHLDRKLPAIRAAIEAVVPVGFNANKHVDPQAREWKGWERFSHLDDKAQDLKDKAMKQLGSLGGGNHFIELCLDSKREVWLLLHSGSRNIGKSLAEIHINKAKSHVKKLMLRLPDPSLAYFTQGTPEYKDYLRDLAWAQEYAAKNRELMMARILRQLAVILDTPDLRSELTVNCHHNFAAEEEHFGENVLVTRKGAVRAREGDMGIIPGSMGTQSYIVRGKGNPDSFMSCSHGAGRSMSRTEAKRRFSREDLIRETAGVECRKDGGVIDEIPSAYKPIERVMKDQEDLVEVVAQIKQVLCVKG